MAAPRPVVPAIRRIEPMASIEEMRRHILDLQEFIQTREPLESGNALDKYLTLRQAVDNGIVIYGGAGGGGPIFRPPPPTGGTPGDWDDLTPPDPLTGLIVTSIPTGFFIEFDAPTYSQGGGNAYSIIYRANYSGAGPLPTFSSAVECGRTTERSPILIIAAEPGTQSHFWAQPVSHAEDYNGIAPQTSPTGGTNGEYTIAGQLSDDHIASLAVGKLLAGSIAVGEYIQSTGFVSGSFGFKLEGDGDAELNNVVVRGTVYATAGLIGGITIGSTNIRSGQTAFNTGTGFWLGIDSGTPKFSIGNPSGNYMYWDGTNLIVKGDFEGDVVLPAFSVSIPEGDLIDSHSNGTSVYGNFTTSVTGGLGPFQYQWFLANVTSDNTNNTFGIYIVGVDDDDVVDVSGFGTDNVVIAKLVVLVTDANGRTCKDSVAIAVTHGTPP